ncbi:hypothetical protein HK098_003292 [Nowakowskiella sp. JEL0407]|nr:hypothetical protein HK098_003292 [Nowakowskiella sp. JEL0407]
MDEYPQTSKNGRNRKVKGMRKSKKPEESPTNTVQFAPLDANPSKLEFDRWTNSCLKALEQHDVSHTIAPQFQLTSRSKDFNRRSDLSAYIIRNHLEPRVRQKVKEVNQCEDLNELSAWKLWEAVQTTFGPQYESVKCRDFYFMRDAKNLKEALDSGWDINIPNVDGKTPLTYAISKKWIPQCEMLIDAGADVNASFIPLSMAGHVEAITSRSVKDKLFDLAATGQYAKYSSVLHQYPKLLKLCTAAPILYALDVSDIGILKRLLEKKADIHRRAPQWDNQLTVLHVAAYRQLHGAIDLILEMCPNFANIETQPDTEFLHGYEPYIGYNCTTLFGSTPTVTDKGPNRQPSRPLLPINCWNQSFLQPLSWDYNVIVFGNLCLATSNRMRVWETIFDSKAQRLKTVAELKGYNNLVNRLIYRIGLPSIVPVVEREWIELRVGVCEFILFHWVYKETGGFGGRIYEDIIQHVEKFFL